MRNKLISTRIEDESFEKLEAISKEEERSVSWLTWKALNEFLGRRPIEQANYQTAQKRKKRNA